MVPNPIYDGPVYESVQQHFDSLMSQTTAASNTNPLTTASNGENDLELCLKDTNHYVHQPGLVKSGSFSQNQPSTVGQLKQCTKGEFSRCTINVAKNKQSLKEQSKFMIDNSYIIILYQ